MAKTEVFWKYFDEVAKIQPENLVFRLEKELPILFWILVEKKNNVKFIKTLNILYTASNDINVGRWYLIF